MNDIAIICSAHLNAVGIAYTLRSIGWRGRIVCLGAKSAIASRYPSLCEILGAEPAEPEGLLPMLLAEFGTVTRKYLFFTHEAFLPEVARDPEKWRRAGFCFSLGSHKFMDSVLDRKRFYEFIEKGNLARVPRYVGAITDPLREFKGGVRARVWKSYEGTRRLPRGMSINTGDQLATWLGQVSAAGLSESAWGYQQLLSTQPIDNVSVSGWHGDGIHNAIVTRKLFQTNENGRIVERVGDPEDLVETSRRILQSLEFTGPFEIEFVRDAATDRFMVIELNSRFWMQHRLFEAISGNQLINAYLGRENASDEATITDVKYWVDADVIIPKLFSAQHRWLVPRIRHCVWSVPTKMPLVQAFKYIVPSRMPGFKIANVTSDSR